MKPARHALVAAVGVLFLASPARADLTPEWLAKLPIGAALGAGFSAMVVAPSGVTYVTGINGPSYNNDIVTAAFGADGALLWMQVFDGPAAWHDQSRCIALGLDGEVWVCGNTPGPGSFANVLALRYDGASGALLQTIQYSSAPGTSEHGAWIAPDAFGNVYIGGGTVGDGSDGLLLKFDAAGQLAWKRTWDGPAASPYSGDALLQLALAPDGAAVALIRGLMSSQHPDYVVVKYAPADGATLWQSNWGVTGGDFPVEMVLDAAGDVYVTGTGLDFVDSYATLKLDGQDGALLWQAYDLAGMRCRASGIALDHGGGVYVTGSSDPDGNPSNQNDNFFTVKRSASDGSFLWSHLYGANCLWCLDVPLDVAVDPAGHVFVSGSSNSAPYNNDALLLVLDADSGQETERASLDGGPAHLVSISAVRFDSQYGARCGGRDYDANSGEIEIVVLEFGALLGSAPLTYCTAKASSCGSVPSLAVPHGVASVSEGAGSFDVTCASVPAGVGAGILIYTTHGAKALPIQNGAGFLCIETGPGFFRVPGASLPNGAGCSASYTFDFGAYLATQQADPALAPGAQVDMQAWYRDPPAPDGANLSGAITFYVGP